ncbi:LCP family protein [Kitasatospora sp. NPDC050543]|uniref:LCP family protein n=1 Tax=Kitasatospora sp. NPDC050543 TaxID=3364054 RepID=UPI0037AF52B5
MSGTAGRRGQEDDGWPAGQSQQPGYAQQSQQYPGYQQQPGYDQGGYQQYDQYDQYGQPQEGYAGQGRYDGYPQQPGHVQGSHVQGAYGQGGYEQPGYEQSGHGGQQSYDQYDQYGQPQAYAQQQAPTADRYRQPGYDGYQQQYQQHQQYPETGYGQGEQYAQPGQYTAVPQPPAAAPVAPPPVPAPPRPRPARPEPAPPAKPAAPSEQVGGTRANRAAQAQAAKGAKPGDDDYNTGEFTFVDEEAEESEDVIDWLKFAESRTERRDERRRKLRTRLIGTAVALAVLAGGGVGYLWLTDRLGGKQTAAAAAGARQVNVVHLRDLQGKVSTALIVNDAAGHKGSVLLLPDGLRLPGTGDSGTTTVGQALDALGPSGTREGLGAVLGAQVAGTWRLDTPYLQLLVSQLGGIRVDTDAEVRDGGKADGKVLAAAGKNVLLNGQAAVAYATLQAAGEGRDAQLKRFGQVLDAVVRTMPVELKDAKDDVHRMGAVLDPSLPEEALAGVLVQLAQQAKDGHFGTGALPVKPDGTLDDATAGKQVKDVLGGTVQNAEAGNAPARVSIQDATGNDQAAAAAQVQVVNAGLTFVPGGAKAGPQGASEIRYTSDARQAAAKSLATSLNLPESAVKKVGDGQSVDLLVVLGKDYQPPKAQ